MFKHSECRQELEFRDEINMTLRHLVSELPVESTEYVNKLFEQPVIDETSLAKLVHTLNYNNGSRRNKPPESASLCS